MKLEQGRRKQIEILFAMLNKPAAAKSFPAIGSLSEALAPYVLGKTTNTVYLKPNESKLFATAAVDAWLRSVHSFMISASLTLASPIWASVAGYYSSHYAVRAIAHLLGCYMLFKKNRIARLFCENQKYECTLMTKDGNGREHKTYWKIVKQDEHFSNDDLFTFNNADNVDSDVAHRDRANYADHIGSYPIFHPLTLEIMRDNLQAISQIEISTVPIPNRNKFPDVAAVQIIAYHRLVKFREMLDEALGGNNKFWNLHRTPSWTESMISFQVTAPRGLSSIGA